MDASATTTAGNGTAKRKRADAGAQQKAVEEVSDAEVEEFYAILRRMRDASRRFDVPGAGAGARAAAGPSGAPAWCPSFSWEDFAPPGRVQPPQQRPAVDECVATPTRRPAGFSLDLNAEPEPEGPPTPRPERVHA